MVSIKHLEDLDIDTLRLVTSDRSKWRASYKQDGSYLEFGWDETGRRFAGRKNAPRCYSYDDWPTELWANSFRSVHGFVSIIMDALEEHYSPRIDLIFRCEILDSEVPNTIPETHYIFGFTQNKYRLCILSNDGELQPGDIEILTKFRYINNLDVRYDSPDGLTLRLTPYMRWAAYLHNATPMGLNTFKYIPLGIDTDEFQSALNIWLDEPSFRMSNYDILKLPLNKKPEQFKDENWSILKPQLKRAKEIAKAQLHSMVLDFKATVVKYPFTTEGLVVEYDDVVFKIVRREIFGNLNQYTHLVKYWLVGGRRPNRPCFLSRTKDWPKEKRLERLEVLRQRFLKHKEKILPKLPDSAVYVQQQFIEYQTRVSYAHGALFDRTMNLFYDTRKRIEHGR